MTGGGSSDNSELIAEIRALKSAILGMSINMDGQRVGNIITEGSGNPGMM